MENRMLVDPFEWINSGNDSEFELDDLLYNISMKIFDYRIENGMNQKEFAEVLEVSQSMVSKLESGEYNPTVGQLHKITNKLGLKIDIVITDRKLLETAQKNWERKPRKETVISLAERLAIAC